jgi:hypothetical protein
VSSGASSSKRHGQLPGAIHPENPPVVNNNYSLSSAMSAYLASRQSQADSTSGDAGKAGSTGTATAATSKPTALNQALERTPASFKTVQARKELDKTQRAVAQDLRTALSKAGTPLKGEVSFSFGAKGALTIHGSADDKAAVAAALKADTSQPPLAARIESLAERAGTVEGNNRRSAAIMQAARHAGNASGLMSLYTSMLAQQSQASATFNVSNQASQIVFKGMVDTSA